MFGWFRKPSKPRLEVVETESDPLEDLVETLRREVNALRYDLDELTERFTRREGRDAKRRSRDSEPANGSPASPTHRGTGLPSLAALRAAGRNPFGS